MMLRIDLAKLTNDCQRINDKVKIIAKSIINETICLPLAPQRTNQQALK